MCPLEIPHSFVPGTKAKANEVNSNFNAIKTFVDFNERKIADNEYEISKLKEDKADLYGDVENKFVVADPVGDVDAVNKRSLMSLTSNTKDYIGGFELTKYDDYTITAEPGNAWDSTYTYMFNQSTALQTTIPSTTGSNATRYVYIKGNSDVASELIISDNSVTPEGIADADKYRMLGSLVTDSEGKISDVHSESNDITQTDMQNLASSVCGYPNGDIITTAKSWTATENAWVICSWSGGGCHSVLYINGKKVLDKKAGTGRGTHDTISFPLKKGYSFSMGGSSPSATIIAMG